MILLANVLAAAIGFYVLAGLVFAIPFVLRGVDRIDPTAAGSTWGFRLIILPGVVALWPLVALLAAAVVAVLLVLSADPATYRRLGS